MQNIFIPKKIKIGYQKRKDTYTGKLAYITYIDAKNQLRKENSWNSWRDEKIEPTTVENQPLSGFVLNKKVGGNSWGWNPRKTYTRVYDPRGFEFEISIPNLLYILENCNSIKGKGLEGEFVYGWEKTELILVPVDAPDYKKHIEFSEAFYQEKITAKDLIPGATYRFSNGDVLVFLGRFNRYRYNEFFEGELYWKNAFFFFAVDDLDEKNKITINILSNRYNTIKTWKGMPKVVQCLDEKPHPEYAFMMDTLGKETSYLSPEIYEWEKIPYTFDEFKEYVFSNVFGDNSYRNWIHFYSLSDENKIIQISLEVVYSNWEQMREYKNLYKSGDPKKILLGPIFRKTASYYGYNSARNSLKYYFDTYSPFKIGEIKRKVVQENGIE